MKVALVCDWLTNVGGAEKVLLRLHKIYPQAPIYTSKYSRKGIDWFDDADVRTGWLQIFPSFMRRVLGPLRMRWFSRLDLAEYDLVISVTGAEAKAVRATKPGAKHICYCHVPTQYYWQMYDEYVRDPGFGVLNPVVRVCFKALVRGQRKKDYAAAQVPDEVVTISEYARELIAKYYKREARVIHPPVEVKIFSKAGPDANILSRAASPRPVATGEARSSSPCQAPEALRKNIAHHPLYYVTTSRQVNWKRIDLAVRACKELRRELVVVGEGPEHDSLVRMADGAPNVRFLPLMTASELAKYLTGARGYIFPSLEPFGIAPVEALASGCPVIAYGKGGALDYVRDGENGVLFDKQTVKSVKEGILRFEEMKFDRAKVAESARGFEVARFEREIRELVDEETGKTV
ncbi:glycosyltransferase [Candidatus Saccharibacteria bacterium]|nr:glycosyltransferase [Candidatus Saccharibacteria bacterium]